MQNLRNTYNAIFSLILFIAFSLSSCGGSGSGQNNSDDTQNLPTALTATMVAAGLSHSVALRDDGTVWTWGNNVSVSGDVWGFTDIITPIPMVGESISDHLDEVMSVEAGWERSFAIKKDGTVYAWGLNLHGELGDGTTESRSLPVQLKSLENVTALSSLHELTLALKSDGTVWSWGKNSNGALGRGLKDDYAATPGPVLGPAGEGYLNDVVGIAAGDEHAMALKKDGSVWTWGSSCGGQLGTGLASDNPGDIVQVTPCPMSDYPVQVMSSDGNSFLTDVIKIAAGVSHSVALKTDGTIWAWGWNAHGELGDGTVEMRTLPVAVLTTSGDAILTGIVTIDANIGSTMAIAQDGHVLSWGAWLKEDQCASLMPTWEAKLLPAPVDGLESVISISTGSGHNLAIKSDHTVWAWGCNQHSQLGTGVEEDEVGDGSTQTPKEVFVDPNYWGSYY